MPFVEVSQAIASVSAREAYRLIKAMERYPEFMPDLLSVTVMERAQDMTVTRWRSSVNGLELAWTEVDRFDDGNMRIQYEQIQGDLKKFAGQWLVEETGDGALVTLTAEFDLGIPMVAALVHPLLEKKMRENCAGMLAAIEKELYKAVD